MKDLIEKQKQEISQDASNLTLEKHNLKGQLKIIEEQLDKIEKQLIAKAGSMNALDKLLESLPKEGQDVPGQETVLIDINSGQGKEIKKAIKENELKKENDKTKLKEINKEKEVENQGG